MSRMGELNLVIRECLDMMTNEYFNGIDDITIKDINDFFKKLNSYKEYDTYKIVYYAIFSYPKNFALHPYREGVITYLNIASKEDILEQIYYVMDAIIKKKESIWEY